MKKILRALLLTLGLAAALGLCAVGCSETEQPDPDGPGTVQPNPDGPGTVQPEPDKKATLSLSAGEGGSLAQASYEVEIGASLTEFVKDIAPTPQNGLEFAGWYRAGAPLSSADRMPEGGLTLEAKYYATYTVESYFEGADGVFGEAQVTTGKAFFGEPFTYEPAPAAHYTVDGAHEGAKLSSEALGAGETFTVYFLRETFTVAYYPNEPDGETVEGFLPSYIVRYGETVALEGGAEYEISELYRFGGWALSEDGDPVYAAESAVTVEGNLFLYAYWDRAYLDRFGGGDLLFLPKAEPSAVYLVRAGEEYAGTRTDNSFLFTDENGEELLKGKTDLNGTFTYYRKAQAGVYLLMNAYNGTVDEEVTLTLDGYGAGTLEENGERSEGELEYDPGEMTYSFVRSDNTGFEFMLTETAEGIPVFMRPGAEQGTYFLARFYDFNGVMTLYIDYLAVVFNGYGTAALADMSNEEIEILTLGFYLPISDKEAELSLIDAESGELETATVLFFTYSDIPVCAIKDEEIVGSFTAEDGATLTLDGYGVLPGSAVYTPAGGTAQEGIYLTENSPLGDLVRFYCGEDMLVFRIGEDGFSLVGDGDYVEYEMYYGYAGETLVDLPVLILGEEEALLCYSDDAVVTGVVTTVGTGGRYLFTSESQIFEFELGTQLYIDGFKPRNVHYFKLYLSLDAENTVSHSVKGGGSLLTDDADHAVFTDGTGKSYIGQYVFYESDDLGFEEEFSFFYFLDVEEGTFRAFLVTGENEVTPAGEESGIYVLYDNGTEDEETLLFLLGAEGKNYAYFDADDGRHVGVYTLDRESREGVFTSDVTFSFFLLSSSDRCFARHNELWEGETTLQGDGHTIVLDGYGFGSYDGNGMQYIIYNKLGDKTYRIYLFVRTAEGAFEGYFDINIESGTYTACDYFWGQYYNSEDIGEALVLDGHGAVTRYTSNEKDENGDPLPLERGSYEIVDMEEGLVKINFEERSFLVHVWAEVGEDGNVNYYLAEYGGAGTYRSEELELLTLGAFGGAYYTDRYGVSYEGEYAKLSEHAVSFESSSLDGVQIFVLDGGTFTHPTSGSVIDGDVLVKYLGGASDVVIPAGVKTIAPLAFSEHVYGSRYQGAPITSIDLGDIETVGENAFNGCDLLVSVTGGKVKEVGGNAFYACIELVRVELPALETIGENAFHLCESLEELTFEKVTTIYSSAFSECHALLSVELPAAEKLYEGVFFDCFALSSVVLGEDLVQLGTPDEPVAGVFARSLGYEQSALTVTLLGNEPPVVGYDLFENVDVYTVLVPDIDAVKAFYLDEGWEEYNSCVGVSSSYDGTYYCYTYGVTPYVLNGVMRSVNYGISVMGAYDIRDGILYLVSFDPDSETKYSEEARGKFKENVLLYDRYGYGLENESDLYPCFRAGEKMTLAVSYADEGDKLEFTPEAGNVFAAGVAYTVPAVWTKGGETISASVRLEFDSYLSPTLNLIANGYRYSLSPYVSTESATVSIGEGKFDPIITRYTSGDSLLSISQNDEEGTDYTVSFVLADIVDEDGVPFSLQQIAVNKDGNSYTTAESHVFAGYSYRLTFTVSGDSFTYTAERERQFLFYSEDESVMVVVYQNSAGFLTMTLFLSEGYDDWKEIGADFTNYQVERQDNVCRWLVFEYNYACDVTLVLSGSGDDLTGEVTLGTVAKGYAEGTYIVAFFDGEGERTMLWLGDSDHAYIEPENVAEHEGYIEIKEEDAVYYVSFDLEEGTADIVFADKTYESSAWDDISGSVRVERSPDGEITRATLTVGEATYTQFTYYPDEYNAYFIFTDGTDYYYASVSSSSCTIYALAKKQFRHEKSGLDIVLLLRLPNYEVSEVVSATLGGEEIEPSFTSVYLSAQGKDYIVATLENGAQYLLDPAAATVEQLLSYTGTTADGKYRVTALLSESGIVYKAVKFEVADGSAFREVTIEWAGAANGDGYNLEIDAYEGESYVCYYFMLTLKDGVLTVSLDHKG